MKRAQQKRVSREGNAARRFCAACLACALLLCVGCTGSSGQVSTSAGDGPASGSTVAASSAESANGTDASGSSTASSEQVDVLPVSDIKTSWESVSNSSASASAARSAASPEALFKKLGIKKDIRESFKHGPKPAKYQKYIVLHDTEGDGEAQGVIDYWDGSEAGVAAHFVVNKDGSIMQCVELDEIAHHAGFGDTGHNEEYGVEDESRDDKVGTVEIGEDFADYGMNSYSIGIEMVHVGGEGDYPEAQLKALDGLIAYIDAYYGDVPPSKIIDHKAWRSGNSDTSEEFAEYFTNYKDHRTHSDT